MKRNIIQINCQADAFAISWEGKRFSTLKPLKISNAKIKELKKQMGEAFDEWYDLARWKLDVEHDRFCNALMKEKRDFIKTQIETWCKTDKAALKAWKDYVNAKIKERKAQKYVDDIDYINNLSC